METTPLAIGDLGLGDFIDPDVVNARGLTANTAVPAGFAGRLAV
jgi:hypothetical protein